MVDIAGCSGANTGYGGSADARTDRMIDIQKALLQLTQSGVLTEYDKTDSPQGSYLQDPVSHSMPPAWVKGMMVVRCNATVRGHSGVSIEAVDAILGLLYHDLIPIVPLKGSVSASGDLMPLAYVAGAIEGNSDVFIRAGTRFGGRILPANEALNMVGIKHLTLGPNEGLGLVNGTAASTALASLALYETHQLAVLCQALTAVAVEALQGNAESFHPFIARVRPHEGQIEAARNISLFLQGSQLAQGMSRKDRNKVGLIQDRYALRSATQWIGPQLEDLLLADRQLAVELNSTADNPLIDVDHEDVYYGANFQAAAATSAMEKSRICLQMFGKLLFAQSTEMIDPHLSNGLPANLAADNPNVSFTMKGVDINMAAYMSELAFLCGPVSAHVQAAEMHNQSINSLAFVSARYTMKAVELVSLMSAASLYVGCQALDLRVMHFLFLQKVKPVVQHITDDVLSVQISEEGQNELNARLSCHISAAWWSTSTLDAHSRCQSVVDTSIPIILASLKRPNDHTRATSTFSLDQLDIWRDQVVSAMEETYETITADFCRHQDTEEFLGEGPKALYLAVRRDLGVPFHRGLVDHPTVKEESVTSLKAPEKKTIGSWISAIYEATRKGKFQNLVGELLQADKVAGQQSLEVNGTNGTHGTHRTNGSGSNDLEMNVTE